MSRNSKSARNRARAAEYTQLHGPKQAPDGQITMTGKRGPARTTPMKPRKNWRRDPERAKDYAVFLAKMRADKADTAKQRFGRDTRGEFRW